MVPLLHTNASSGCVKHFFAPPYFCGGHGTCTSVDKTESPVTWPEALIASPRVTPPPSEPRSVIVYVVAAAAGAAAAVGRPTATASTAIKARGEVPNRVMTPSLEPGQNPGSPHVTARAAPRFMAAGSFAAGAGTGLAVRFASSGTGQTLAVAALARPGHPAG